METSKMEAGEEMPTAEPPGQGRGGVGPGTAYMFGTAVLAGAFGFFMTLCAFYYFENYYWTLFVLTPIMQGVMAGLLHGLHPGRSARGARRTALASCLLVALGILLFHIDGLICVLMVAPIVLPLALLGAFLVGLTYPKVLPQDFRPGTLAVAIWVFTPGVMGLEKWAERPPPVHAVTTSIIVDAPREVVWEHVIEFPDLPPPAHAVLRTGIAYPLRATIEGRGVGAIRHCEFSTGPFVEPITVWDPPRHLAFDVASQPAPMKEWTLFAKEISAPHLEDMRFVSHRGEFRLTELEDGRTLMQGTTWYTNAMAPVFYWKIWSDWIIHTIHEEVLQHIKAEAEGVRVAG